MSRLSVPAFRRPVGLPCVDVCYELLVLVQYTERFHSLSGVPTCRLQQVNSIAQADAKDTLNLNRSPLPLQPGYRSVRVDKARSRSERGEADLYQWPSGHREYKLPMYDLNTDLQLFRSVISTLASFIFLASPAEDSPAHLTLPCLHPAHPNDHCRPHITLWVLLRFSRCSGECTDMGRYSAGKQPQIGDSSIEREDQ